MSDFKKDLEKSRRAARAFLDAIRAEAEAAARYEKALGRMYSKTLEYYNAHRNRIDAAELDKFTRAEQEALEAAEKAWNDAKAEKERTLDAFVEAEKKVAWWFGKLGLPYPR
jgi:hypothetical protein